MDCSICCLRVETNQFKKLKGCPHSFCENCIVKMNSKCALCRNPITPGLFRRNFIQIIEMLEREDSYPAKFILAMYKMSELTEEMKIDLKPKCSKVCMYMSIRVAIINHLINNSAIWVEIMKDLDEDSSKRCNEFVHGLSRISARNTIKVCMIIHSLLFFREWVPDANESYPKMVVIQLDTLSDSNELD